LTTIMPSRADVPSFAATRNDTLAVPCPDGGDNAEIQLTLVDASQPHSGCVVTASAPEPPPASNIGGAASAT
jgi:hypothetical protein